MLAYAVAWLSTAIVFASIDALWVKLMTARLYRPLMGQHLAEHFNYAAAAAFYLLYVTGLVILVIAPAMEKRSLARAMIYGALLGLVAYGAYDLTNQASLRGWDMRLTLADMAWGAFASALAASAAYSIASHVK